MQKAILVLALRDKRYPPLHLGSCVSFFKIIVKTRPALPNYPSLTRAYRHLKFSTIRLWNVRGRGPPVAAACALIWGRMNPTKPINSARPRVSCVVMISLLNGCRYANNVRLVSCGESSIGANVVMQWQCGMHGSPRTLMLFSLNFCIWHLGRDIW